MNVHNQKGQNSQDLFKQNMILEQGRRMLCYGGGGGRALSINVGHGLSTRKTFTITL